MGDTQLVGEAMDGEGGMMPKRQPRHGIAAVENEPPGACCARKYRLKTERVEIRRSTLDAGAPSAARRCVRAGLP